jgi:hypothetical protein
MSLTTLQLPAVSFLMYVTPTIMTFLQDDDSDEGSDSDDGGNMDADGGAAKARKPQRAVKKVTM